MVSAVLHVAGLNPATDEANLRTFFTYIGSIARIDLSTLETNHEAFVEFSDPVEAAVAMHLNNTIWIDRPIKVVPSLSFPGEEPQESLLANPEAAKIAAAVPASNVPPTTMMGGLMGTGPAVPLATGLPLSMSHMSLAGGHSVMHSASLDSLAHNVDPNRLDDIRRTIYVGNLDSQQITAEDLLEVFKTCGPINFVRMAGDEKQPTRFAFIEFGTMEASANALVMNGVMYKDRPLKVNHSKNAIVKPPPKKEEAHKREVEEKMRQVLELASKIAADPSVTAEKVESESNTHDRDRTREKRHRSRSGSREREKKRRSRSRSRERRSSKSRDSTKDRDRERSKRSRSRGRDRDRDRRRSASPAKSSKKDRRRDRDRDRN